MNKALIYRVMAGLTLAAGVSLLSGCVVAPVGYGYDTYGAAYPAYPATTGYAYGAYGYGAPVVAAPAPVVVQPAIGIGLGLNYSRGYYGGGGWGHHGYGGHYWRH